MNVRQIKGRVPQCGYAFLLPIVIAISCMAKSHAAGNLTPTDSVPDLVYNSRTGNVVLKEGINPGKRTVICGFAIQNEAGTFRPENTNEMPFTHGRRNQHRQRRVYYRTRRSVGLFFCVRSI